MSRRRLKNFVLSAPSLRQRISGAFHKVGRFQTKWLAIVPLILLAVDFGRFPCLFAGSGPRESLDVDTLLSKKLLLVGTLKGHSVQASSDTLENEDFLHYVRGSPKGLVVSYFLDIDSNPPEILEGEIGRALKEKLLIISPDTNDRLKEEIKLLRTSPVTTISTLELNLSRESYGMFPIDRIYLVLLNNARKSSNKDALEEILPNVMRKAVKDGVPSLVVPCFGYDWKHNTAPFSEFFEPLVKAVGTGESPAQIYIPLYEDWDWNILARALSSLTERWEYHVDRATQNELFGFFRTDYRSSLIFLCFCLFVSSFYAPLNVQNGVIISLAYLGAAVGITKSTDFFTQGYSMTFSLMFKAATRLVLALLFPFVVNWNPKNVFAARKDDNE